MKVKSKKTKTLLDARVFSTKLHDAMRHDLGSIQDPNEYQLFFKAAQEKKLLKKFISSPDPSLAELAIEGFLKCNDDMGQQKLSFDPSLCEPLARSVYHHMKYLCWQMIGEEVSPTDIFDAARHSSGVTTGVKFTNTSLEAKWQFPITVTKDAEPYFHHYLCYDEELNIAIRLLNEVEISSNAVEVVEGSKLCTVPKTSVIDRTIAPEPTFNMFLQQGVSNLLWGHMEKWGLSLAKDQTKHRKLAAISSVTNHLATLDLSNASDRVGVEFLRWLLPPQWFATLMDIRSPRIRLPSGEWVELHMMSSMGNATTFPIETLVLWVLALSATHVSQQAEKWYSKYWDDEVSKDGMAFINFWRPDHLSFGWRQDLNPVFPNFTKWCRNYVRKLDCHTFGDDIIVPSNTVPLLLRMLTLVGMIPNVEKSFFGNEFFRESCGGDFFHGRDVRPFYLKSLPRTQRRMDLEAYLYATINRVIHVYKKYYGPLTYCYDKTALTYLFDCLKVVTDKVKFVPDYYPEDSGITELLDAPRIVRNYKLRMSPIGVDKHGCLDFLYLRFTYPKLIEWDEHLRYAVYLKHITEVLEATFEGGKVSKPSFSMSLLPHPVTELEHNSRVRVLGKYVQARVRKEERPHLYGNVENGLNRFSRYH